MNACSWACAEVTTVLLLCGSQELKSDHQDCLQAHLLTDLSPQPINLFFKKKKTTEHWLQKAKTQLLLPLELYKSSPIFQIDH